MIDMDFSKGKDHTLNTGDEAKPANQKQAEARAKLDQTNPKDLLGIKKPRLSLIPPAAIIHESLAMQNGADKYGPYNWRSKKVQAMIYVDALMRHVMDWVDGEEFSKDTLSTGTPVHHLGHARACLGILLDAIETGNLVDNRPPKGPASDLMERFTKKHDNGAKS